MCAEMVSASRPGSSIPEREVSTSEGTFLLSPTYFSNCSTVSLTSEADSFLLTESVSI